MAQPNTSSGAASTVVSDYGSLALRTSCDDRSCDLPALRFESGDLVIKLTNDPRDWLLVHSEIVAASSPVLAASLSRAWAQYAHLDSIKHPSTGENVLVRTLALTQVEGTFFLEGKDVELCSEADSVVFQHSAWSEPGWPDLDLEQPQDALRSTIKALRILFALFYGARLNTDQLAGEKEQTRDGIHHLNSEVVDIVCAVCAYAEYFLCDPSVEDKIVETMQSAPNYWAAIAENPVRHITLAVRLQLQDLYYDAIRHLICQAASSRSKVDWNNVAEAMRSNEDSVRRFFEPQLRRTKAIAASLHEHLSELEKEWIMVYDPMDRGPSRTQRLRGQRDAVIAVNDLWKEWWKGTTLQGGTTSDEAHNNMNAKIRLIEQFGATQDSTPIFEKFSPTYLYTVFQQGSDMRESGKTLRRHLERMLREANFNISTAFFGRAEFDPIWGECRYGRARFDAHRDGYFTYMKVPFGVPWNVREQIVGKATGGQEQLLSRVDTRATSRNWMVAVALELGAKDLKSLEIMPVEEHTNDAGRSEEKNSLVNETENTRGMIGLGRAEEIESWASAVEGIPAEDEAIGFELGRMLRRMLRRFLRRLLRMLG